MNILVVGESCLDVFVYGECKRICPEAPVPVFNPIDKKENGGMAHNVYMNLFELTNFGEDRISIISSKESPVKTRYVDKTSNQMVMRLDEKDNIERINWGDYTIGNIWDAVIISDYNKGFLTENDIEYISEIAKRDGAITFLDTKKKLHYDSMDYYQYIDFIKINEHEYEENKLALSKDAWYHGNLVVTLGSRGARYKDQIIPIENKAEVRDLSGAGDTFLAALVVEYLRKKDVLEAIKFANKCASWVVTQKGVVTIDKTKI